MKHITYFFLTLAFALSFSSCKKDENDSNSSGGSGACSGINCQNGGTCVNGQCSCPSGFYGNFCENQVAPTGMTVTKITLLSFPATDGGAGWDLTSGPDVYVSMGSGTNCVKTFETNTFIQNATSGGNQTWNVSWQISSVNNNWSVCVWDYDDLDSDDLMGGLYFRPSDQAAGWPSTITLNSGNVSFRLNVQWQY